MKTEGERIVELAQAIGIPERQWSKLGLGKVVDLSGELGGGRNSIVNVLINRGGTAVERWMANDKTGLFEEGQQRAIRYTQGLWIRAEGKLRAVDPTRDVVDEMVDGMSQQEALDELQRLKSRVPNPYWDVYENVCRFDEEAGVAGSRLASNSRSAIDAAKTTVAFTASLIAQWRRL
ncbi:MAG: hypothetical protein J7500_15715 [Sphingomonas sp.]|uniref:hypothetical protein n=1 Tax=Sphingomonas sp. TaxID=28214 RepID=UPI001B08E074|nr:hypothetical protein [Sphingomonas sp.]MBO9624155.1 hypothetical protein [Sphingomonas sp.]